MGSVWFCIPSARPPAEANLVLDRWRAQGYKIALWRDPGQEEDPTADMVLVGQYPGYSCAVNAVVQKVLRLHPDCTWCVTGGDDTEPDSKLDAATIAAQCTEHFGGTFGIMQPTGDRWANGSIDRICGSPWMGREFCERAYAGAGPMWPEYWHNFNDDELQAVAIKLHCFWQRRDLAHMHHHWMRTGHGMPDFLQRANSGPLWNEMKHIFETRRCAGFPGHEPLAVAGSTASGSQGEPARQGFSAT
jgi:hypothetical protein